jgi:hypothetical protein
MRAGRMAVRLAHTHLWDPLVIDGREISARPT